MIRAQNKIMKDKKIFQWSALRHTIRSFIIVMPLIGNPGYGMEGASITSEKFEKSLPTEGFQKQLGIIGAYFYNGSNINHMTITSLESNNLFLHLSIPVTTSDNKTFTDEKTKGTAEHNYHIYYRCPIQEIEKTEVFIIGNCTLSETGNHLNGTNIAPHGVNTMAIVGATYDGSVTHEEAQKAVNDFIKFQNTYATQEAKIAQKKAAEDKVKASEIYAKKTKSMEEDPDGEGKFYNPKSKQDISKTMKKNLVLEESIKTKLKKASVGISINKILNKEELAYYNSYMKK